MAGITMQKELNLMLIGKTGQGKSATGNTILGHRAFIESSKTTLVTKEVVSKFTRFDNFPVKVVDCPGLMDTDRNSGEDKTAAALNMATALGMCNGGVDAFILVIRRDRFTEDQIKSLDAMKTIFGDRYKQHLIVVVTRGDQFKEDMEHEGCGDMCFKNWCNQERGAFKQLFNDFSDRFLLINNREKDPQKHEIQRREIIQLADSLRQLNGRYTSKSFEEAKAARDKFIVQENLPMLIESLQLKVGLLAEDLLRLKTAPSNRERESILRSLDDLRNEITEKDKGTGLLNHLMAKVRKVNIALHDVDELHRLAEKLENIREERSSWYSLAVGASLINIGVADVGALFAARSYGLGRIKTDQSVQELQDLSRSEEQIQAEIDKKMTKTTLDIKK